jgi:AraC-like DNA-binding protein
MDAQDTRSDWCQNIWSSVNTNGQHRERCSQPPLADILLIEQQADVSEGVAGSDTVGKPQDSVVMHMVLTGSLRFTSQRDAAQIEPGELVVRSISADWKLETTSPTIFRLLVLPRAEVRHLLGTKFSSLTVTKQAAPEARLLLSRIGQVSSTLDDLTQAGAHAARDATLELLAGVLDGHLDAGNQPVSLRAAAMNLAEDRLLDPDLDPAAIAKSLNVSIRTLYRAFADADEPVMAYVRRRRLERAYLDLVTGDGSRSVSELAARWHFSDTSHFVRAFKQRYGETPARFMYGARGGEDD